MADIVTPPSDRPLRVAVVGCGDISPLHLEAIAGHRDAVLVGVADPDPAAARGAAGRYAVPAHGDLDELLAARRPDVVHLCTPHDQHVALTLRCLDAGVHVLTEKPVATTVADGEKVAAAARSGPAVAGVCFQNRYNATSRAIRRILDGGQAGRVLGARASVAWFRDAAYYRRRPWRGSWARAGGGVLINQAIHTLDLLLWYLGEPVALHGVAARLALPDSVEVEDSALLRLTHAGGTSSIFSATNGYVDNAPIELEIRTEHAVLRLDGDLTVRWGDGRTETVTETAVGGGERAYWGDAHALLIDDFYRHVRAGRRFPIDPDEALKTLRVITSVYEESGLSGLRRPAVRDGGSTGDEGAGDVGASAAG